MREQVKNQLLMAAAGAGLLLGAQAFLRRSNAYSFRGKNVLIAGGSRGLGLEIARQLVREGARLAICARDAGELDAARRELEDIGAEVFTISCDITDVSQVGDMVRSVTGRFGSIDVLINTAGMIAVGPMETMRIEDFEEAMNANFWGPLYTCLAVLPEMKRRREGRIVNVSSIGGKISVPHLVPYSASKFALVGFSRGLRAEVLKDGVVVTTICPGLMRTGSPRNAEFKGQNQAEYAWFKTSDSTPLVAMSSERAAAQIVDACRYGYAEVILTIQAKLAARFDALFPEWDSALISFANRLLPEAGGIGTQKAKGHESESSASQSPVAALTDRAAERNNEI